MDAINYHVLEADRSSIDAVLRRMIADRESRIAGLHGRIEALRALIDREARIAALKLERPARGADCQCDRAIIHRLIHDLAWPDGPRALRAALPVARMIRATLARVTPT